MYTKLQVGQYSVFVGQYLHVLDVHKVAHTLTFSGSILTWPWWTQSYKLWLSVSLGRYLHDLDVHTVTNSNFEFQQYYPKKTVKLSVRDSTVCFGSVATVRFFPLLHHAFSLRSSEVSWNEVAQEANADVLPNRLQRGRVEVRVVRHCNRGQSCTLLQQRSELYVAATEVRAVCHCNRGQSCTLLQQRSELYITATELRAVCHCNRAQSCTSLQQSSELFVTATELRVVRHCNRGQSWMSLQQCLLGV